MKCDKCGYDDNGSGDTAHACTFYQSLSQQAKTPPHQWVGLTKKEFQEAVEGLEDLEDCWVAIEAKLKEKNNV